MNVMKSAVFCGFGYIYCKKILNGKLHFCAMYDATNAIQIERMKRFKNFICSYEATMNSKQKLKLAKHTGEKGKF